MTAVLRGQFADRYRFVSAGGLAGWIRKDLPENILAEFIRDPDGWMDRASSPALKDGQKTKVVRRTIRDVNGVPFNVIAKRFHYRNGLRRWGFLFFPAPARRSLRGALLLEAKGVLVPQPLAALEYRDWKRLGTSYYVSEEVGDSHSLQDFWRSVVRTLPPKKRAGVRRSVMRDLARLLARLHAMNIYHRDLKTSNILIQGRAGEGYRVYLVDLDRVGERPRLSFSKKLNNLLQVRRRAWSAREQIYFFMRYAEGSYPSTKDRKALARKLFALSLKKDRLRPCRPRRMARRTDD